MSRVTWIAMLTALAIAGIAKSDTYWIAWEGNDPNDWPENSGWTRCYNPPGANRTLEDGILTYDSIDPQIYDYYERYRTGALDPTPGTVFMMEWRLFVQSVTEWTDPAVGVQSDEAWSLGYTFGLDFIDSAHEYVTIPFAPGVFHDYTLISADMRGYELYIDGVLAREGWFAKRFIKSRVGWGDSVQGVASIHHWDYFRCGVVPEPQTGDVNCDGFVDFGDINPFVEALTDPDEYQGTYPGCPPENADINADGSVDFGDINPFVDLLLS
jgi:hypothetical protein